MKVWIDQDLCTGDGLCEEIAPDVFVMDLEGLTDGTFPPQPAKLGSLATGVTQVREHVVRPPEGATELGTEEHSQPGSPRILSAPALAAQVIGRQSQAVTSSHEVDASSQT